MCNLCNPKFQKGTTYDKGMIHRLSTALKNTWRIVSAKNSYLQLIQLFINDSMRIINKSDFRIVMNPYLKRENNTRFWSKCLSWTYVYINIDKILSHLEKSNSSLKSYQLFKKWEGACRFWLAQWIYCMEVMFHKIYILFV